MSPSAVQSVDRAHAGVIDDLTLDATRVAVADLRADRLDEIGARLLLLCLAPLLEELAAHRSRAAEGLELVPVPALGGNVVALRGEA